MKAPRALDHPRRPTAAIAQTADGQYRYRRKDDRIMRIESQPRDLIRFIGMIRSASAICALTRFAMLAAATRDSTSPDAGEQRPQRRERIAGSADGLRIPASLSFPR